MSSSYKPKLIQFFFQEKDNQVPQLIQLTKSPLKQLNKDPKKQKKPQPKPEPKSTKPNKDKLNRLDVSSYKCDSISAHKQNLSIHIQQQYIKTSKRVITDVHLFQQQDKLNYQKRIQQLQSLLIDQKQKIRQVSTINLKLIREKQKIEKQMKDIKLAGSYVSNKGGNKTPSKIQGSQVEVDRKMLDKLQIKLKISISQFLENIKIEEISASLEIKIEEFLTQLITMCPFGEQVKDKSKQKQKQRHKEKQNKVQNKVNNKGVTKIENKGNNKHSRNQSPIASQSFVNNKLNFEYSPYLQLSTNNHNLSIQFPSQLVGQHQKNKQNNRLSLREQQPAPSNNQRQHFNVARFSFVRESVFPSVTDQSAFISISHIDKSTDKSYEGRYRSKSQRRRKIFE